MQEKELLARSSVFGLKLSPSTATDLPRSLPENIALTLRAIARFLLSLTAATASRIRNWTSCGPGRF